jgi:hypothetical protein
VYGATVVKLVDMIYPLELRALDVAGTIKAEGLQESFRRVTSIAIRNAGIIFEVYIVR